MTTEPGRTPPREVVRALTAEVGFRCPVAGCGSPYLSWHHFDPPWRAEHHHRPEGMIALCVTHAHQADNRAFTGNQLRALKRRGRDSAHAIAGQFNWMRQTLLARVGGNYYYETPVIFQIGTEPCIWFGRNDDGELLLNFRMPTISTAPRAIIRDNCWEVPPAIDQLVCPPMGRLIEVTYENGDMLKVEFTEVEDPAAMAKKFPDTANARWLGNVAFPITLVDAWETAAGTNIEFGPHMSRVAGGVMVGCFFARCGAGIYLEAPPDVVSRLLSA